MTDDRNPTTRRAALGSMSAVAASAFLAACGSRSSSTATPSTAAASDSTGAGGASAAPSTAMSAGASTAAGGGGGGGGKTAKIGVIAPFNGPLSAVGLGLQYAVALAIKEANAAGTIKGWTLVLDAQSDDGKVPTAQNAATGIAADPDIVAVVGTLNSSTAEVVQPILAKSDIVMISPSNTNPTLTQGAGWVTSKKRPFPNYFRVCTTDAIQGPFAAQYVFQTLGIKSAATINDTLTYGKGLTATFQTEFTKLGGKITKATTITPGDTNFSSTVTQVKATQPGLVYYGGQYPEAGPLSKQMGQGGLDIPLMGGDGIYDPLYIKLGGRPKDACTSVGAPIESLASGKSFIAAYKAGNYPQPYGSYGGYAFDAANAIIKALAATLPSASSAKDARAAIVKAVQGISFAGVGGPVGFDQYGDATNKTLTVYTDKAGAWTTTKTGSFSG